MKILVTGANGFVGSGLLSYLLEEGHEIVAAVRKLQSPCAEMKYIEVGNIDETTDWKAALQGVDAVVHTAARVHVLHERVSDPMSEFRRTNVQATLRLANQAAQAGVKRFVFISTIGVLGNYSMEPMTEDKQATPSNAYSASKWEAENELLALAETGAIEVSIIRPPLVYGPGVKANFLRLMCSVDKHYPMPFGRVRNKRDFVSRRNLCSLIGCCITHAKAKNEIFHAADGEQISTPDLIKKLSSLLDRPAWLLPIPVRLLHKAAQLLRKERLYHSVCNSLRVDISKAQHLLGWKPVETLDVGLKKTVDWYRTSGYAACDNQAAKEKS